MVSDCRFFGLFPVISSRFARFWEVLGKLGVPIRHPEGAARHLFVRLSDRFDQIRPYREKERETCRGCVASQKPYFHGIFRGYEAKKGLRQTDQNLTKKGGWCPEPDLNIGVKPVNTGLLRAISLIVCTNV
jgi:hypothetical protein